MRIKRQIELRAEARRISGVLLDYSDTSASHRERFEPGSVEAADNVLLNWAHDPERALAWTGGGGLELIDGEAALELRAELPPIPLADHALAEIRAGRVTGLSVEFQARRERREAGLRVIERAELVGVGLVRSPSYDRSRVEARRRRRLAFL